MKILSAFRAAHYLRPSTFAITAFTFFFAYWSVSSPDDDRYTLAKASVDPLSATWTGVEAELEAEALEFERDTSQAKLDQIKKLQERAELEKRRLIALSTHTNHSVTSVPAPSLPKFVVTPEMKAKAQAGLPVLNPVNLLTPAKGVPFVNAPGMAPAVVKPAAKPVAKAAPNSASEGAGKPSAPKAVASKSLPSSVSRSSDVASLLAPRVKRSLLPLVAATAPAPKTNALKSCANVRIPGTCGALIAAPNSGAAPASPSDVKTPDSRPFWVTQSGEIHYGAAPAAPDLTPPKPATFVHANPLKGGEHGIGKAARIFVTSAAYGKIIATLTRGKLEIERVALERRMLDAGTPLASNLNRIILRYAAQQENLYRNYINLYHLGVDKERAAKDSVLKGLEGLNLHLPSAVAVQFLGYYDQDLPGLKYKVRSRLNEVTPERAKAESLLAGPELGAEVVVDEGHRLDMETEALTIALGGQNGFSTEYNYKKFLKFVATRKELINLWAIRRLLPDGYAAGSTAPALGADAKYVKTEFVTLYPVSVNTAQSASHPDTVFGGAQYQQLWSGDFYADFDSAPVRAKVEAAMANTNPVTTLSHRKMIESFLNSLPLIQAALKADPNEAAALRTKITELAASSSRRMSGYRASGTTECDAAPDPKAPKTAITRPESAINTWAFNPGDFPDTAALGRRLAVGLSDRLIYEFKCSVGVELITYLGQRQSTVAPAPGTAVDQNTATLLLNDLLAKNLQAQGLKTALVEDMTDTFTKVVRSAVYDPKFQAGRLAAREADWFEGLYDQTGVRDGGKLGFAKKLEPYVRTIRGIESWIEQNGSFRDHKKYPVQGQDLLSGVELGLWDRVSADAVLARGRLLPVTPIDVSRLYKTKLEYMEKGIHVHGSAIAPFRGVMKFGDADKDKYEPEYYSMVAFRDDAVVKKYMDLFFDNLTEAYKGALGDRKDVNEATSMVASPLRKVLLPTARAVYTKFLAETKGSSDADQHLAHFREALAFIGLYYPVVDPLHVYGSPGNTTKRVMAPLVAGPAKAGAMLRPNRSVEEDLAAAKVAARPSLMPKLPANAGMPHFEGIYPDTAFREIEGVLRSGLQKRLALPQSAADSRTDTHTMGDFYAENGPGMFGIGLSLLDQYILAEQKVNDGLDQAPFLGIEFQDRHDAKGVTKAIVEEFKRTGTDAFQRHLYDFASDRSALLFRLFEKDASGHERYDVKTGKFDFESNPAKRSAPDSAYGMARAAVVRADNLSSKINLVESFYRAKIYNKLADENHDVGLIDMIRGNGDGKTLGEYFGEVKSDLWDDDSEHPERDSNFKKVFVTMRGLRTTFFGIDKLKLIDAQLNDAMKTNLENIYEKENSIMTGVGTVFMAVILGKIVVGGYRFFRYGNFAAARDFMSGVETLWADINGAQGEVWLWNAMGMAAGLDPFGMIDGIWLRPFIFYTLNYGIYDTPSTYSDLTYSRSVGLRLQYANSRMGMDKDPIKLRVSIIEDIKKMDEARGMDISQMAFNLVPFAFSLHALGFVGREVITGMGGKISEASRARMAALNLIIKPVAQVVKERGVVVGAADAVGRILRALTSLDRVKVLRYSGVRGEFAKQWYQMVRRSLVGARFKLGMAGEAETAMETAEIDRKITRLETAAKAIDDTPKLFAREWWAEGKEAFATWATRNHATLEELFNDRIYVFAKDKTKAMSELDALVKEFNQTAPAGKHAPVIAELEDWTAHLYRSLKLPKGRIRLLFEENPNLEKIYAGLKDGDAIKLQMLRSRILTKMFFIESLEQGVKPYKTVVSRMAKNGAVFDANGTYDAYYEFMGAMTRDELKGFIHLAHDDPKAFAAAAERAGVSVNVEAELADLNETNKFYRYGMTEGHSVEAEFEQIDKEILASIDPASGTIKVKEHRSEMPTLIVGGIFAIIANKLTDQAKPLLY